MFKICKQKRGRARLHAAGHYSFNPELKTEEQAKLIHERRYLLIFLFNHHVQPDSKVCDASTLLCVAFYRARVCKFLRFLNTIQQTNIFLYSSSFIHKKTVESSTLSIALINHCSTPLFFFICCSMQTVLPRRARTDKRQNGKKKACKRFSKMKGKKQKNTTCLRTCK